LFVSESSQEKFSSPPYYRMLLILSLCAEDCFPKGKVELHRLVANNKDERDVKSKKECLDVFARVVTRSYLTTERLAESALVENARD
jgi:hypothetical protein